MRTKRITCRYCGKVDIPSSDGPPDCCWSCYDDRDWEYCLSCRKEVEAHSMSPVNPECCNSCYERGIVAETTCRSCRKKVKIHPTSPGYADCCDSCFNRGILESMYPEDDEFWDE